MTSSGENVAYFLEGLVPVHLIRNIKGMVGSGIWEWWRDLYRHNLNSQKLRASAKTGNAERPNMSGNILLVFLMWLGGHAIGLFCLILEWLVMISSLGSMLLKFT